MATLNNQIILLVTLGPSSSESGRWTLLELARTLFEPLTVLGRKPDMI